MSSVIDLRAYVNPSVIQTLVLVDLQQEYVASPRVLALEETKGAPQIAALRSRMRGPWACRLHSHAGSTGRRCSTRRRASRAGSKASSRTAST